MNVERLEEIFYKRYQELASDYTDDEFFINWCDKHKIIMLHPEWLADTLNQGGMNGKVCIESPEQGENTPRWLLVPRKLADKTLILDYLP